MIKKIKPFINIGPGQIIKREMDALNWTQEDLSEILGMSLKSINQIINNKQSITVETATLLAKAFNSSAEFWLNLDKNYRLRQKEENSTKEEKEKEKETNIKAEIRKYMPILDMKRKGWVQSDKTTKSQVEAYCEFWEIENIDFKVYETPSAPYCARQTKNNENYTKYYTLTWHQKAKIESQKINSCEYSKSALEKLIPEIPKLTLLENGVEEFIGKLYKAGVKFFVLSHLSKTYLDGASFLNRSNPVVVYTGRYDRVDNFWWTITHEIAHVLFHLNTEEDCFIDNLDEKEITDFREKEANEFTKEVLKEKIIVDKTRPYQNYMTESRLIDISKTCGLSPSVVLGILQFNGIIDYRVLSKYKKTVMDLIPKEYIKG